MHIHICLVSAQLLPNYIPVRIDRPDMVYLISTAKMRSGLTVRLQRMLEQNGIQTVVPVHNLPDAGINAIRAYATELVATLQRNHAGARLTLNVTGGNKLMSIGMLEVFRDYAGLIYTDTDNGCIEHIDNGRREPIQFSLGIPEYLAAYGALYRQAVSDQSDWCETAAARQTITQQLADVAEDPRSANLITSMNAMAVQALSRNGQVLERPEQHFNWEPRGFWEHCVQTWADAKLFSRISPQDIYFTRAENTRYLAGVWLEEFAWLTAKNLGLNDVRSGVEIAWEKSPDTLNELDVLVMHNNKMLVIECKTLRMQNNPNFKPSDILYKIDSIGDNIKGLFGKAVLLSAMPPPAGMIERARTQNIDILRPSELEPYLQYWSDGGRAIFSRT